MRIRASVGTKNEYLGKISRYGIGCGGFPAGVIREFYKSYAEELYKNVCEELRKQGKFRKDDAINKTAALLSGVKYNPEDFYGQINLLERFLDLKLLMQLILLFFIN